MPPKAMMKGRVVVGTKHVGTFGKLHEITDTVKDVINAFVQKAAEAAERTLVFRKVYSCATEEHMIAKQGTVLDPDDLSELTVAYKEGIDYQCGDSLFDDDAEGDDKQLAETFHVRRAITCRDPMEQSYFNHGNVRGCVDLEWVCSRCGAGPNESPLDPKTCGRGDVTGYSGFAFSKGQMMLPTCMTCMAKWQASGDKKLAPILVGTTNQVDKERSRQEAKAKQRASKKAAAEASSEEEEPEVGADAEEEEEEEAGEAAGSSGEKRKAREQRPAPQSSSSTSGAAKRHAKAAAASPPSLAELVDSALSSFRQRKQLSLYRSMLRAAVRKIDPAKRAFGDKAEWVGLLQTLQQDGLLTYTAATDSIVISAVQDV